MLRFPALLSSCALPMLLAGSLAAGAGSVAQERTRGLDTLNRLRRAAGMAPFAPQRLLDKAAQSHADYLARNRATGHGQTRSRPGFTGAGPVERAAWAGYPHRALAENVAEGQAGIVDATDALMSGIYHRLGFLAFGMDEVGIGISAAPERERYVFNLGVAGLTRLCGERPAEARHAPPGSFYEPCRDGFRVRAEHYTRVTAAVQAANPRVVLWPPAEGSEIPPAFFNESPDPLPDYQVSGYPLSVQFNPAHVQRAAVRSFRVFHEAQGGRRELRATRLLDARSDPHDKFGPLEFALFPLQRLGWDQAYAAEAVFAVDGREETFRWRFRTRAAGAPLYTATAQGETLPVVAGRAYAIYVPPTREAPLLGGFQYRASHDVRPHLSLVDGNTLRVRVEGQPCGSVDVTLARGRRFTLRIAERDALAGPVPPEELYAQCPEYAADYRIAARGELLPLRPGRDYLVYVQPSARHPRLVGFQWRAVAGLRPQVAFASADALRIRVEGALCGQVDVEFQDGRRFRVQLAREDRARKTAPLPDRVPGC
jgi:uncharacterized protein YkwD